MHIVTSITPSELQVEDAKNDGPRILKKHLKYIFVVSADDEEAAKQVLHSFIVAQADHKKNDYCPGRGLNAPPTPKKRPSLLTGRGGRFRWTL